MDRVISLAERLGKAIGETDRFNRLRQAEKLVQENADARKALDDLEAAQADIARKESEGKPIEPDEKRRVAELQASVHNNEALQTLARAQADYMEMMNRVNTTIRTQLGTDMEG